MTEACYSIIIDVDPDRKDLWYIIQRLIEDLDLMKKRGDLYEYAISLATHHEESNEITLKTAFQGEQE